MIYIAHRGLFDGPDNSLENNPDQIAKAINLGFDVEIDVRMIKNKLFLGHDSPTYEVDEKWFDSKNLWIHCKNIEALYFFSKNTKYNFFWHDKDDYTLTSKNYIWTNIGRKLTSNSIMVMPEIIDATLLNTLELQCYGVCSDYVNYIKALEK